MPRVIARVILTIFLLATVKIATAQTGPGGVGSSSSNVLWLRSEDITGISNGNDISTWSDVSGNSNDLSQPNSSFTPVFITSQLNGFPVVRFNKSNGRLRRTGFADFPTSEITAIYINRTTESGDGVVSYASSSNSNDFLLFSSNSLRVYRASGNINSNVNFSDNAFHIANAAWRSSDGRVEVWQDGAQSFTSTGFRTGTSITAGGSLALAGEQDAIDGSYASSQAHFGDFTEVLIFNTYLNEAQLIILNNYLSSKYGLAISNDRYSLEGTHPNDIVGIGREDGSNEHTAARSAGILQIEGAAGLDANQEYLLFGHDNADVTTSWTTTEAPNGGTNIQRLAREWRLDETGDVGDVDFLVDVATFPTLPVDYTMYALMVDSDGDFSAGASVYELSLSSGTEYSASGISIADGDYIALAAVRPVVDHTISSSSGSEEIDANIEVSINFVATTSQTVDVSTADVTATAGDDYTALTNNTVTILAGASTASYNVSITNDTDSESNETFTATLLNPSAGLNLGTNTIHTYSIEDNDNTRKVYFDAATSSASESSTNVSIGLSLSAVDAVNPTTVDYAITGGTAEGSGTDYTLAAGTVTFLANTTAETIDFTVNNESLFENAETIIITLSNPTNANLDNTLPLAGTGFIEHTYTITNDDTAPSIQFNTTSSSGSEVVSPVNIQVDLSTISGADASVNYTVTGAATGGSVDYTLADGSATITAGNTTVDIIAAIINDAITELSETIILTLSAPSNATLGSNTVFTYTIVDSGNFGFIGPGGVGGNTNNVLWVRPEELDVVADGTDITSWTDNSSYNNDLTQANTSFTPRYYNSVVNGFPTVRFEQSNGRLVNSTFNSFPSTEITTLFVNRNSDSADGMISYASSASDNEFLFFRSESLTVFRGSPTSNSGVAFNDNAFNIGSVLWQSSGGAVNVWKNGTNSFSGTLASGTSITSNGSLALAGEQDGINSSFDASQSHEGDFAEVIIYNVVLSEVQNLIVQNYLAAKYGLTLSANDIYVQDNVANGNYDYEVAGIGRISSSDLHLDAQGSGIVRINNPQDLDDEEFLFWGHDNSDLRATSTNVPLGVSRRWERVWRVSEANRSAVSVDVGSVDISFDLTNQGNVTPSNLVLLIDADGDFSSGAAQVTGAIDDGGNIYRFANVAGLTDGMRFTLATTNASDTPLPVTLLDFEANMTDRGIMLDWSTVEEINNSHFDVERSHDGLSFIPLTRVLGKGNSSSLITYDYLDNQPLKGWNYYRLKQNDFNGEFEYSQVISIFNPEIDPNKEISVVVYPNPVLSNRQFQIRLNGESGFFDQLHYIFFSSAGKQLKSGKSAFDGNSITLSTDGLSPGLYFIKLKFDQEEWITERLIVR